MSDDGFRPRKIRPDGWREWAIAEGIIRDPNAPPEPDPVYPESTHVIAVPVGSVDGAIKEE